MAKNHEHLVRALQAMSEGMIKDMGDHPTARQLQADVNRLKSGVAALNNVNANRSPLDTEAAHALKVAKLARKLGAEIETITNRSCQIWGAGYSDATNRIEEKINLKPDAFATEIRTAFRELKGKDKLELLSQLVDQNRGPELAAILRAPPVLTGLSEEQRSAFETSIVARHASAELDEQQKLTDVWDISMAATKAAASFVKELTNPDRIAQIERDANASDAAGNAFDQSLQ